MRQRPIFHTICLTLMLSGIGHAGDDLPLDAFLENYCLDCHDAESRSGELNLEPISAGAIAAHRDEWEKAVRRMGARQMPPANKKKRPDEAEYQQIVAGLVAELDALPPEPGEIPAMRRLTRTEYRNAIRDLLGVEVDVSELLPKDESSHGFDNITVGSLSSTLLNRYVSAAQKISRVALGGAQGSAQIRVLRVPGDRTQEERVEGLPPGTRGGILIEHTFPVAGEYEIDIRLTRDRNEVVEGLSAPHKLMILLDREKLAEFTVEPPPGRKDFTKVDAHLNRRLQIGGGTHQLGVTFLDRAQSLLESKRQPYDAQYNMHRHPRQSPAVFQVSISGPFSEVADAGETPSRKRILIRRPTSPADEEACAREILGKLMRKAYRRPINADDLEKPMAFFREGQSDGGFELGIELALSSILVNPQFLFRIERAPDGIEPGTRYNLDPFALASRLAFFLWSSLPDEELLDAAESGRLLDPGELDEQVRRMLEDPRSATLATNFANQWLQLRNLEGMAPDLRLFPDFDDNLRHSFTRETELFFQSILTENRSVIELLEADYTFLDERLAKHYEIPNIYGSRFRRIALPPGSQRGGLLRHGSILMVTSYANRTSPVIRGNWILENVLGTPTPPPPPDIPALEDAVVDADLPMRERLAVHRADQSCATCHNLMDPIGFSLENFDAVGRWREQESEGSPVDSSGGLPDGQQFTGVDGLEDGLRARPELFARTVCEKLLTYALGRGVESYDAPAVRRILADAEAGGYRLSDIILGITKSVPFTMRKSP